MTSSMGSGNIWEYGHDQNDWADQRLVGYKVEAVDGSIGKIDEATGETGAQSVVVDTGPWIFGQKVMLPAGLIDRVDHDEEKVYITADKDRVKNSPNFNERNAEPSYREQLGSYYGEDPRSTR
jgi:hypothetical protein